MGSSPKFVFLFFLLTTLLFSLQTYARDSHFFSKVTRNRDEDTSSTTTPNTNKFFMNNKEKDEFVPLSKQEEPQEQPTFIPQTTETGYGLYGHETGLDPPSTTTTSLYNMDQNNNNNNKYDSFNNYFKNNNEDHHEKNYASELKGLSTTNSYGTNESPSKFINNNNNFNDAGNYYDAHKNEKYYNGINSEERYVPNNNNNEGNNKYYGARRYNGVHEKQGMSDTRFLENGKYYYDLNNGVQENGKYYYDLYNDENHGVNNNNHMSYSNNKYNDNYETNGYYGNKEANYEANYVNNNNNNNLYRGNGMKGYQGRIPEDERFDFDDQP